MDRRFLEPTADIGDRSEVLLGYFDYFRATVADKLDGVEHDDLRRALVPSGWSMLELVKHLVFMERRWLVWGFLAETVDEPWGDSDDAGRWRLGPGDSVESLLEALGAGGRRTRRIVESHSLAEAGGHGGRFPDGSSAPTLERIVLHVLQEYARHAGHLDVARELLDGTVGE